MAYLDENGLEHFWGKIKDRVSSAVAPKADDAGVVHKTGDETVGGVKTLQNTASGHGAGETVTDLIIRNPEVERGTPVEGGRSYTRVILADREGDIEQTLAGRLGLLEVVSPKENDTIGEELRLGCYKYSNVPADYGKDALLRVGYDLGGISYATAPATSDDRANSTDIVTRGYMEASERNWQKTKKAGAVTFRPVPESNLEPVVYFMFTETPPAEGEKGPENPSAIAGVSSATVTRCETEGVASTSYTVQFGDTYYGGSLDVATGVMTVTHAAVAPAGATVDISSAPAALPLEYADTYGRVITSADGTSLSVGSSGGTVVYRLAAPATVQLTPTQIRSLPALNKYAPRLNTVYSDQEAVQVGYQKFASTQEQISRVVVRDTNNYPFHRIAYIDVPESYKTYSLTLFINAPYVSSGYGIARVSIRTYSSSTTSVCSVYWLARTRDLSVDVLQVGFRNTGGNSYVDVFIHTSGGYDSYICRVIDNSDANNYGFFFNVVSLSSEDYSTTASDRRKSIESYASIASAGTELHNDTYTNTIYASDRGAFVDLTTNQTINGQKTFTGQLFINTSSDTYQVGVLSSQAYGVKLSSEAFSVSSSGAYLNLNGRSASSNAGYFGLCANSSAGSKMLQGMPDGTLTWDGQPIQTSSDERVKTSLASIPDKVLDAWEDVAWGQFQYLEALAAKGESARLHLGLIAQHVMSVFENHGLDACSYGILCHEERSAVDEEETVVDVEAYVDEEGVEHPAVTHTETRHEDAVDLWMVRYAEAQAMEAACQRRENARLKKRIADLEERLAALELKIA